MVFQIEFSDITDTAVLAVTLITWCFAGMRILYGYWPWQSGPKKRNAMSGEIVSYQFLPSCEINREKTIEMRMEKPRLLAGASRAEALDNLK
jgi:hypothetical protein